MHVIDLAAARRRRGLPALSAPGRLDTESARALRLWRCYTARWTQRDAADAAGVSLRHWVAVETARTVPPPVLARCLAIRRA